MSCKSFVMGSYLPLGHPFFPPCLLLHGSSRAGLLALLWAQSARKLQTFLVVLPPPQSPFSAFVSPHFIYPLFQCHLLTMAFLNYLWSFPTPSPYSSFLLYFYCTFHYLKIFYRSDCWFGFSIWYEECVNARISETLSLSCLPQAPPPDRDRAQRRSSPFLNKCIIAAQHWRRQGKLPVSFTVWRSINCCH